MMMEFSFLFLTVIDDMREFYFNIPVVFLESVHRQAEQVCVE